MVVKKSSKPISGWHGSLECDMLKLSGLHTGCGLMQLSGIASYATKTAFKEAFDALLKECKDGVPGGYGFNGTPCTTFICTLGRHYAGGKQEKWLFDLGFVKVAEYKNSAHPNSPKDKQRLYLFTL